MPEYSALGNKCAIYFWRSHPGCSSKVTRSWGLQTASTSPGHKVYQWGRWVTSNSKIKNVKLGGEKWLAKHITGWRFESMPSNCKLLFLLSLQLGMFCVVGNMEFMLLSRVTSSLSIPKSIGSGLVFFFFWFIYWAIEIHWTNFSCCYVISLFFPSLLSLSPHSSPISFLDRVLVCSQVWP